jgi:hypothetical protein
MVLSLAWEVLVFCRSKAAGVIALILLGFDTAAHYGLFGTKEI